MNGQAINAIGFLMHEMRPEWDTPGCVAALRKLSDMPLPELLIAAARYCADDTNLTPGNLPNLSNRAWDSDWYLPCKTHPLTRARRTNGECAGCFADRVAATEPLPLRRQGTPMPDAARVLVRDDGRACMTATRCGVHGVPVRDATICPHCTFDVEKDLGDVAALAEDLDVTISRQTAVGYREGGRSAELPLPFNVNASTVATELHATLAGWVRAMYVDPTLAGPAHPKCGHTSCALIRAEICPANDSTALSRWLLGRKEAIRQHTDAVQLHDEIGYAVDQARKAVDRPKNRSRVFVGPCLEDDCGGELWARFPLADYEPNDPSTHAAISCTACDVTYPADQWLRVGTRLLQRRAS